MLKSFKLILTFLISLTTVLSAFAQDDVRYKAVVLDGKPAKLNIDTGEIIIVKTEVKDSSKLEETVEQRKSLSMDDDNLDNFYVVKENETLFNVSKKYGVSLTKLMQANNLESTLISKGQTLRVKNFDAVIETTIQSNSKPKASLDSNKSSFHNVVKGETLYSLAKKYGLTLSELKTLNNLKSNLIKPGQKLRLNLLAAPEEVNYASVWTVSKGDTLYSIAKNNGTTVKTIKNLNGLTGNVILIGQKLQLR